MSGHHLSAYSFSGQKLWGIYSICDLIVTDKDYIYTVGYNIAIDDIAGDEKLVLSKYKQRGYRDFQPKIF